MHVADSAVIDPASLGVRTRSAIGWRLMSQGLTIGLQLGANIVLARLLMPGDFGILGMATMVAGLAGIFRDLGLGQALVQRKHLEPVHLTAAYWGTMVMGVLLTGLTILLAPYLAEFFKEPRLVAVLQVIALTFLISPLATIPNAVLQRELDFRRPFYAAIAGSAVSAAVCITMALSGYGYWSLVYTMVASTVVGTVALCVVTRHCPPLVPSFRGLRDLCGFGAGAAGVSLFYYVSQQIDYLVVVRRLNAEALGLYTRAFTIISFPLTALNAALSPVLFSAFSQMQGEVERARRVFAQVLTLMSTLAFPALALLMVAAPEAVPLVFGSQWTQCVVPVQILAFAGMLKVIGAPAGAAAKAQGPRYAYGEAWRQAVHAGLLGTGAWYGSRHGIVGVSWAVCLVVVIHSGLMMHLVRSSLGFAPGRYFTATRGPLLSSLGAALAAWLGRSALLILGGTAASVLAVTLLVGGAAAFALTAYSPCADHRRAYRQLVGMARRQ